MISELKNVVIVGASSGVVTARALADKLPATHRLVLIEANEVAFWPIGALRAAVEPGFEKEVIAPLTTLFKGTRHVVLPATRVISFEPTAVVVDRSPPSDLGAEPHATTDGYRIGFDHAVLALGASYSFPSRTVAQEESAIIESFKVAQRDAERAQNILVIGGGPVGVEYVGEVLERFPSKGEGITLVTRSDKLIANGGKFDGVHTKLLSQLKSKGVRVLFEDEVDLGDLPLRTGPVEGGRRTFKTRKGIEVQADYILDGTGGRPNTAVVKAVDAAVLNEVGAIRVEASLRVKTVGEFDWSHYLAIGDCNDLPHPKTWMAAEAQAKLAATNLLELIKGGSRVKAASAPPNLIVVPLGKKGGAAHLFAFSLGGWFTSMAKGKTLFVSNFKANFQTA